MGNESRRSTTPPGRSSKSSRTLEASSAGGGVGEIHRGVQIGKSERNEKGKNLRVLMRAHTHTHKHATNIFKGEINS